MLPHVPKTKANLVEWECHARCAQIPQVRSNSLLPKTEIFKQPLKYLNHLRAVILIIELLSGSFTDQHQKMAGSLARHLDWQQPLAPIPLSPLVQVRNMQKTSFHILFPTWLRTQLRLLQLCPRFITQFRDRMT